MKLRIKDNTIRLRLSQTEVRQVEETGLCMGETPFLGGNKLRYTLQADSNEENIFATFERQSLTVFVPADMAQNWAKTDLVGLEASQAVDRGGALHILIEKDFQCLHRDGEEEKDNYPHPQNT